MCFSATASFISGGVITGVGVATLMQTTKPRQLVLAAFPLLFGLQQFTEGFVWLSLENHSWGSLFTYLFIFFAHLLWLTITPIALFLVETDPRRKQFFKWIIPIGIALSLYKTYYLLQATVGVQVVGNSLSYQFEYPLQTYGRILYALIAVSVIFSTHKWIKIFGFALVASLAITYSLNQLTYISVWCFFAALISAILFIHFRKAKS